MVYQYLALIFFQKEGDLSYNNENERECMSVRHGRAEDDCSDRCNN